MLLRNEGGTVTAMEPASSTTAEPGPSSPLMASAMRVAEEKSGSRRANEMRSRLGNAVRRERLRREDRLPAIAGLVQSHDQSVPDQRFGRNASQRRHVLEAGRGRGADGRRDDEQQQAGDENTGTQHQNTLLNIRTRNPGD